MLLICGMLFENKAGYRLFLLWCPVFPGLELESDGSACVRRTRVRRSGSKVGLLLFENTAGYRTLTHLDVVLPGGGWDGQRSRRPGHAATGRGGWAVASASCVFIRMPSRAETVAVPRRGAIQRVRVIEIQKSQGSSPL
jgi:hypothetical protein